MQKVSIIIVVLLLIGCSDDDCRQEIPLDPVETEIEVQRLERDLRSMQSPSQVLEFLKSHQDISYLFLDGTEYPSLQALSDEVFPLIKNEFIDTLFKEVENTFPSLEHTTSELNLVVRRIKTIKPSFPVPKMKTVVTGMYKDLVVADSLIILGLDYFLGPEARYQPLDIPNYILRRYDQRHLVPIIAQFWVGELYPKSKSETLIAEMVDFGKTYYILSRILPCTPETILMGYTAEELSKAYSNEAVIWANLVENEVLYDKSHLTRRMFLGERPNVYEISKDCPGRIGAWIGWRIVETYMNKTSASIEELMRHSNNEALFRQSGYKPRNR